MFLTWLFGAATPESETFDLNDPKAWDALGVERSSSGIAVSTRTALTLPAFWRGVSLLSGYLLKVPMFIYRRHGQGKERAKDHPSYNLVRWKINSTTKASVWKQTIMTHALTKGNGYTYLFRRGDASIEEGVILDPNCTFPVRENGQLLYVTTLRLDSGRTEMRKLLPENVHHIHGFGWDGTMGYDVVSYGNEALGRAKAQQRYSSVYFKNSGRPAVVLMFPEALDKPVKDELVEGWERMHAGIDNSHKTAVVDRGGQIKELSGTARDNQLTEREKLALVDVANLLGLPVHKVGGEGKSAYASLEQENQSLLDDTLDPWLVQWEEETRDKFLTEREKDEDTHTVECNRNSLVSVNFTDRMNGYRAATGGRPWLLPDEVRGKENENPLGGEAGEYLNPLNMGQGGPDNEERPPGRPSRRRTPAKAPPPDEGDDEDARAQAHRQLLAQAVCGQCKRIGRDAAKAAKDPDGFTDWVAAITADHAATARKALAPVEVLIGAKAGHVADWLLTAAQGAYMTHAGSCTAKQLAAETARLNEALETKLADDAAAIFLETEA